MKRLILLILVLGMLQPAWAIDFYWHSTDGEEAKAILVPGEPPLTVGQLHVFVNCLEFGLSIALTQREEESVRSALMQEYLTFKAELVADLKQLGDIWQEVIKANADDRHKYRQLIRDAIFEELGKNNSEGIGQVLFDIQKMTRELIVPGNPKVDKRSMAAFFELVQMALRLRDKRVVSWNTQELTELEKRFMLRLSALSPEGRKWLSNADFHRSIIVKNWQKVPADEKETVKRLFIETFAPKTASASASGIDLEAIPLPPPNLFPLPNDLPWEMR